MMRSILGTIQATLGKSGMVIGSLSKLSNQYELMRSRRLQAVGPDRKVDREQWLLVNLPIMPATVVDVGANVGEWTEMAMTAIPLPMHHLLVEPLGGNAQRLREKFAATESIQIIQAAVSDADGQTRIHFDPDNNKTPSLAYRPYRASASEDVRVVRLEQVFKEAGWEQADYLKIDTEGYDLHVLRGAKQLLRERRIGALQFEYLGGAWRMARSTLGEAMNLLERECDWKCWMVGAGTLLDYDYARHGEMVANFTFFAVPEEKRTLYASLCGGSL